MGTKKKKKTESNLTADVAKTLKEDYMTDKLLEMAEKQLKSE